MPVGVVEQVDERPFQPGLVTADHRVPVTVEQVGRPPGVDQGVGEQLIQRERVTQIGVQAGVGPGQFQQVVQQPTEPGQLGGDQLQRGPGAGRQVVCLEGQHVHTRHQGGQRGA